MLTHKQKELCAEIAEYFKELDPNLIKQEWGALSEYEITSSLSECGACVGAHLDRFFSKKKQSFPTSKYRWLSGAHKFADRLNLPSSTIESETLFSKNPFLSNTIEELLHEAGATKEPFSTDPWPTEPAIVFERLSK